MPYGPISLFFDMPYRQLVFHLPYEFVIFSVFLILNKGSFIHAKSQICRKSLLVVY